MSSSGNLLECRLCGHKEADYLGDHLLEIHGVTAPTYLQHNPGAIVVSARLKARFDKNHPTPKRAHPTAPTELGVSFQGIPFAVHPEVPPEACLPMPDHYRLPEKGTLREDVEHALIALKHKRSMYVWGLPGSGKDALFHAWSAATRTPAIVKQIKPKSDIESWFFCRGFTAQQTVWEEGEVLKALRDGYTTPSGQIIPYLILFTDFDRAGPAQAENLRLISDSIQGRIDGPAGRVYTVLPGTRIAATGNTAGAGDERGRMVSAAPMDASLMDRFERKLQFHWLDWADEILIVQSKFPVLVHRCPSIFSKVGLITGVLRTAILAGDLYGEFSHRAVCSVLGHAQDILLCGSPNRIPKTLLKMALRPWLDGLPDSENRMVALRLIDAHIAMLDEGNTDHISTDPLTGPGPHTPRVGV